MPTRDARLDRALAMARRHLATSAEEFRSARVAAGISQRDAGSSVGLSRAQVGRFERAELADVGIERLCRLSAAVGLAVAMRLYPDGDAVRDVAHISLLGRLRALLPPTVRWRTEVPIRGSSDLRAWDAVIDGTGCVDAVEAETRLGDIQAMQRRVMRKLRDDPSIEHVILLIADTRHDRRALESAREALRGDFPLDTRQALARLRQGVCPSANAVVIL